MVLDRQATISGYPCYIIAARVPKCMLRCMRHLSVVCMSVERTGKTAIDSILNPSLNTKILSVPADSLSASADFLRCHTVSRLIAINSEQVTRRESCRVTLNGHAEFEARDVVLNGDISYQVPDGFRMLVTSAADGRPQCRLEPLLNRMPSWQWKYSVCRDGLISLTFEERESRHSIAGSVAAEKSLAVRDYRWGGQGGISVRSLPSTLKASGRPVRLERTSRANHPFGQLRQTEAADWSWLSSQL